MTRWVWQCILERETGSELVPTRRMLHDHRRDAWQFDDKTPEQYEKVFAIGGSAINNQPARNSRMCASDARAASPSSTYGRTRSPSPPSVRSLAPATQQAGLDVPPPIFPVQGFMAAYAPESTSATLRPSRRATTCSASSTTPPMRVSLAEVG